VREMAKLTRFRDESLSLCIVIYQNSKGRLELNSFVLEYVREKGNGEASEVLADYMEYLHLRGYVIRRNNRSKAQTDQVTNIQKPLAIHLV